MAPALAHQSDSTNSEKPRTELVFGIVAPIGTDLDNFTRSLSDHLVKFNYEAREIRLSNFLDKLHLEKLDIELIKEPESKRLDTYMTAGNKVRESLQRGDALALHAATEINRQRSSEGILGKSGTNKGVAYILRSLKHPDEVNRLRQIYGPGFYLIALYSTEKDRLDHLSHNKNITEKEAMVLMKRDEEEQNEFGQQTRKTFSPADVFILFSRSNIVSMEDQLYRFLDLVFGNPYITPYWNEYAMYMAYSASLRSSSLSRQVGAAIFSQNADLIAIGTNDVPCAGGGLYWPGEHDKRDHTLGYDSNDIRKDEILNDLLNILGIASTDEVKSSIRKSLLLISRNMAVRFTPRWKPFSRVLEGV
ncbi:MAG: hypothetical protein AB2L14_06280 [Candidatus Xenobiia bacterium LiM19]